MRNVTRSASRVLGLVVVLFSVAAPALHAATILTTGQTVSGTKVSLTLTDAAIAQDTDLTLSNLGTNLLVEISPSGNGDQYLTWNNVNLSATTYLYAQVNFASASAGLAASGWQLYWQDDDSGIGGGNNSVTTLGAVTPSASAFSVVIDLTESGTLISGAQGWGPGQIDHFRLDLFEGGANLGESFIISSVVLGSELSASPGGIAFTGLVASNITASSAALGATVSTNLTSATLVWDTSNQGASISNWAGSTVLGAASAGTLGGNATGLNADTLYRYRFYGETAVTGAWSSTATFPSSLSPAQAPVFTSADASWAQLELAWADQANTETSYILQRGESPAGPFATIATLGPDTSTYLDSAVSDATTYSYRLAASNSVNKSATAFALCTTNATTLDEPEGLVFYESFENPQVPASTADNPNGWNTTGHPSYMGIAVSGATLSTPYGRQMLTGGKDSHATTASSILDHPVTVGKVYELSFHVAKASSRPIGEYYGAILAIDGSGGETVLATVAGDSPSTDMSYSTNVSVIATNNAGERLAVRLSRDPDYTEWNNTSFFDHVILRELDPPPTGTVLVVR